MKQKVYHHNYPKTKEKLNKKVIDATEEIYNSNSIHFAEAHVLDKWQCLVENNEGHIEPYFSH